MSENRTRLIRPQTRADGKLKSGNGKSKSSTAKNTGSPPPFLFFVGARGEPWKEARNNHTNFGGEDIQLRPIAYV